MNENKNDVLILEYMRLVTEYTQIKKGTSANVVEIKYVEQKLEEIIKNLAMSPADIMKRALQIAFPKY